MLKKIFFIVFLIFCYQENITAQIQNLNDSALYYYKKNDFDKAIYWEEKNIELIKNQKDVDDSTLAGSLLELAFYNNKKGINDKAESLFLEAEKILIKRNWTEHIDYAKYAQGIARLYKDIGKYSEAERLLKKSIDIYKNKLGLQSNEYNITRNNIANLYILTGNYEESEKIFLEIIVQKKSNGKTNNVEYATALNNLAVVYRALGNYNDAESLYKEAILIYKQIYEEEHLSTASAISNLATLYFEYKKYLNIDSLCQKALFIRRKILGEQNIEYALSLHEIGNLYRAIGKYDEAENLLLRCLEIRKSKLGENHPDYAVTLNSLGGLYFTKGDFLKAEFFYLRSLTYTGRLFGKESMEYINKQTNLGNLYRNIGKIKEADTLFSNSLKVEVKLLTSKMTFLSEKELVAYLKSRGNASEVGFYSMWFHQSPLLVKDAYNTRLVFKAASIDNSRSLLTSIENSKVLEVSNQWQMFKFNKSLLSKILSQPISKRNINTDSLASLCNQQEKELLRSSADYRGIKERLNITWQDVQQSLSEKDVAIEFVKFKNIKQRNSEKDTIYYAALLLRKQDTIPIFIKLLEESQLKATLKKFAYKAAGAYITSNAKSNKGIYQLLWQPIEPYLKNIETIYFAPDGLLHNVSFAAIPFKNNLLLSDKYNLVQLTSTRQIVLKDSNNTTPASIALFGGINYNKQNIDTSIATNADPYSYVYQQNRSAGLDSFAYLPNTLKEVQGIKASMQTKQKNVVYYTGSYATEAAFRNLGNATSPTVVHFATHGFTLPDSSTQKNNSNTFKVSDNPLLRTGLVLAGGNKGWNGNAGADEDDGILTALEISSVQLPNTQLAVLSACETGVGELRGSEGVFGLQRAFKLAGVNYIMASLWQVPDKETAEFMNTFYTTWLAGKTIRQSFIATQQHMRKKYAPYYWAGFTLVQ